METKNEIMTYTGISFNPFNPKIEDINIQDIGHALSLICRANGHTKHFYSVAQHSLYCMQEAKHRGYSNRVQLACLLHDASEAYIADITRPVKSQLENYLKVEAKLQAAIFAKFNLADLTEKEHALVAEIDDLLLHYELKNLLNIDVESSDLEVSEQYVLDFMMMDQVRDAFIQTEKALQQDIKQAIII